MPNSLSDRIEHFQVRRDDAALHRWVTTAMPTLSDNEAVLAVDLFSFTANNVTYAMFGDSMNYWQFFPTGDTAYGAIPVWGFAEVVASKAQDVSVGERFYGFFPMSTHLKVNVSRVTPHGFIDGTLHRRELPSAYNQYVRCSNDTFYAADREPEIAILRPLFTTSFLLDDLLRESNFYGASQIVFSSASSKTAFGTAACVSTRGGVDIVGLTSRDNVSFVKSLGCYSAVLTYDELRQLDRDAGTVYVDFSGSTSLRLQLHEYFADALKYSCGIGSTHWQNLYGSGTPVGPEPVPFFAPSQAKKRVGDWGAAVFQSKLAAAWDRFLSRAIENDAPWLNVVTSVGHRALEEVVGEVIRGDAKPDNGHVVRFT